jgi:hypothetical protein
MKKNLAAVVCLVMLAAVMGLAQDGYDPARVVAFEKVASSPQHPENADKYKISMQLGDTFYKCEARGSVAVFNDWSVGKEYPTRLSPDEKVLSVKGPGGEVELVVKGKKR